MSFKVPESKRSIGQNLFTFEVPGDATEYTIPKAKYMTVGQVELLAGSPGDIKITDVLSVLGQNEPAAAAVRTLDVEQMQALMTAWQEDSGLVLGESSASS